jgi:UDP-glucose 4-epimerase
MGGAGYIGSHTVRHLLDNGYEVIVADNLIYGHREAVDERAKFVHADLLDTYSLDSLFKNNNIEAVIHFAAFAYVGESVNEPEKYYYNNVIGTVNLLHAMFAHNVKKIVFSSTCATYGEPQYTPIDEKHNQNPINPYGRTKLMIEQIFADYERAYGLQHIALRYFNAAGCSSDGKIGESHTPETHLIPLVLKAITGERDSIKVFGTDYDTPDGTCIRDYIHVEDLALAHRLALENLGKYNGCINLGTGIGTSVKEIIVAAEKVSGKKCPVEYVARRAGDPARLFADNTKAKEILNWQPKYTNIEDIIETAWNWELNRRY